MHLDTYPPQMRDLKLVDSPEGSSHFFHPGHLACLTNLK